MDIRELNEKEVNCVIGSGKVWANVIRPLAIIAAGAFAGPGGAASAVIALYGGESLYSSGSKNDISNALNAWGEFNMPSQNTFNDMMNNPYNYE